MIRIIILVVMLTSSKLFANEIDFNNGCGTGWNEPIVPEEFPAVGANFKTACSDHDNCYSRCLKHGIYHKTAICEDEAARKKRKKTCDDEFLNTMNESCVGNGEVKDIVCKGLSSLYHLVVVLGGDGSFNGEQIQDFLAVLEKDGEVIDIEAMEKQLLDIINQDGYQSDQKINFNVKDKTILVSVGDNLIDVTQPVFNKELQLEKVESIHYGTIDVTNMIINGERATIQTLDVKNLDINEIRQESNFKISQ